MSKSVGFNTQLPSNVESESVRSQSHPIFRLPTFQTLNIAPTSSHSLCNMQLINDVQKNAREYSHSHPALCGVCGPCRKPSILCLCKVPHGGCRHISIQNRIRNKEIDVLRDPSTQGLPPTLSGNQPFVL